MFENVFKISALTCAGRRMGRILGVLDKKKISENILIFMIHEHFVWNITGMHRDTLCVHQDCVSDGKRPTSTLRRTNARAVSFRFIMLRSCLKGGGGICFLNDCRGVFSNTVFLSHTITKEFPTMRAICA